jgi:multiple sugar transport system substrate-binding protein
VCQGTKQTVREQGTFLPKPRTEGEIVSKRLVFLLCAALACAVLVAACGGDDDGGGGATPGTEETGATEGVKAVDPASMENAKGEVTYCSGKDTSGDLKETIAEFNKDNPDLQVKLVEFPEDAQQQHDQFVQRQKAKSGDCDAFEEDVVWTAEFASQKWLMDMSDYIETRKDDFIPSTLETVTFDGKVFGAPRVSDAGMMYYRTDQVKEFPATWQELYTEAEKGDGIVYQGSAYEGLTVDYLEYAFAAGGTVLNEDGSKSTIDSPENLEALKFMVDGIKNGAAPKAVTTMQEEPARRAWEAGKATFMRNWSYCYALSQKAPNVKGKFAVAPYPEWEGGGKAAVLGGHNMVISVYSKNPGGALKFIDYATSPERITKNAVKYSKTPTIGSSYDDAGVKKAMPFADALRQGVENAKSRPVSPVYPEISEAIFKNVNEALAGQTSPEDALKKADEQINAALQAF